MITGSRKHREILCDLLDRTCSWTHVTHHIPVPASWFESDKYSGWRHLVCHALYGCPLADLGFRILKDDTHSYLGTPWRPRTRPHPDDPYGDGMDDWGDPTDHAWREHRAKVVYGLMMVKWSFRERWCGNG